VYFNKIHDPANCVFPQRADERRRRLWVGKHAIRVELEDLGEDVFRVRLQASAWPVQHSQVQLLPPDRKVASRSRLEFGAHGDLTWTGPDGQRWLSSVSRQGFGVCGQAWLFQFEVPGVAQYYGMGEKNVGFERSALRTKFWNTDVWADFPMSQVRVGPTDPMYANVPWVILKQGNEYIGLLLHNPGAVFLRTPAAVSADEDRRLWLGAPDGLPELYLIAGPSLPELVEKFQRLVGVTPRPPLWALGHQQCRWGYQSQRDLEELAQGFREHAIPNDGLWLDIDYMQGYRVFTLDPEHWPQPKRALRELERRGHPVVAILDPGIKRERGYHAYDDGLRRSCFCLNSEGRPFVGYVWPGRSVFPDFSLPRVREWWAGHVAELARQGFSAAWVDMNDPCTGSMENEEMRFDGGRNDHASYHNQYGSGMAEATRAGFQLAYPERRPFVLTRSAFLGAGQHAAVWTGDNCSSFYHLSKCIEVSLNLALSGIPFNGPDVPGFGDDATPELALAWYKVCFLFPFLRNHSHKQVRRQEPWTFGASSRLIRHYIRLRYKLLPYLYQLFVQQERVGAAILRPLFYDYADRPELELGRIPDQFAVGPALLQAPIVEPAGKGRAAARSVVLPEERWFDAQNGAWLRGGRRLRARCKAAETPLYVRAGSLVPMQVGERSNNQSDLSQIELHVFCPAGARADLDYHFDDGRTLRYQRGKESRVHFEAEAQGSTLRVKVSQRARGFGALGVRFVLHAPLQRLVLEQAGRTRELALRPGSVRLTGRLLRTRVSRRLDIG
jgi:alpha-glucosidase